MDLNLIVRHHHFSEIVGVSRGFVGVFYKFLAVLFGNVGVCQALRRITEPKTKSVMFKLYTLAQIKKGLNISIQANSILIRSFRFLQF